MSESFVQINLPGETRCWAVLESGGGAWMLLLQPQPEHGSQSLVMPGNSFWKLCLLTHSCLLEIKYLSLSWKKHRFALLFWNLCRVSMGFCINLSTTFSHGSCWARPQGELSKTWLVIRLKKQDLDTGRRGPAPGAGTAGLSGLRWRRLPAETPEAAR